MSTDTWRKLKEEISRDVWRRECADMMIYADDADERWERLPKDMGPRVEIDRYVGSALIALEERGLIKFED